MSQHVDSDFEREKVCFEQNCSQFQSLNRIMWQVPIIAMSLTGGLWFAVSRVPAPEVQFALLALAAAGNGGLIFVLKRIRYVMQRYLDKIREFHPKGFVEAAGNQWPTKSHTVVRIFVVLLAASSIVSLLGLCFVPIN